MIEWKRIVCGFGVTSIFITGCATTSPDVAVEQAADPVEARSDFIPANYIARVKHDSGPNNRLLALPSHAVWVDKNISEIKQAYEQQNNPNIEADLVSDASMISDNFIVIECHVETMFPDSSIAYDVSGLRNLSVYLSSPGGNRIYPLQHLLLTPAAEKQVGTLKQYNRTNLFVFALDDIISGSPTLPAEANTIRLHVEGYDSSYFFEWTAQEPDITDVIRWRPTQTETYQVLNVRFSELYSQLRTLTRIHRN